MKRRKQAPRKLLACLLAVLMLITSMSAMLTVSAATGDVTGVGLITNVEITGQKVIAVALRLAEPISASNYRANFDVEATLISSGNTDVGDRTVTKVYVNDTEDVTDTPKDGQYIIIELDPEDSNAGTVYYDGTSTLDYTMVYKVTDSDGNEYFSDHTKNLIVDDFRDGFTVLKSDNTKTMNYQYYDPIAVKGVPADQQYPLILFLHGSGECGNNNRAQLKANKGAVAYLADDLFAENPCYVIAPQLYDRAGGLGFCEDNNSALIMQMLEEFIAAHPNVDPDRIYVQGLSQGGRGTWDLILRYPTYFAAAIPICGNANEWLDNDEAWAGLKNMPIWTCVASDDGTRGTDTAAAVAELRENGNTSVKFYNYNAGSVVPNPHHSWELVYEDYEIYTWLFQQTNARTNNGEINPRTLYTHEKYNDDITIVYDYDVDPMYLIEKEDKALLIDTGMGSGDLYQYIVDNVLENKDVPIDIYFPHNHGDHTGDLPDFIGKDQLKHVYVHENDSASIIRKMGSDPADIAKVTLIDDGDTIDLGGEPFEFITVFGHTAGHTVGLWKDYLFTSDAIGSGYVWMAGGCIEDYVDQLQHLNDRIEGMSLTVLGGHAQYRGTMTEQYVKDILECAKGIVDGTITGRLYERSTLGSRIGTYGTASIVYMPENIFSADSKEQGTFDLITKVASHGQEVIALAIDTGMEIDGSSIDASGFRVTARNTNPYNDTVTFDGVRNVVNAYVNDEKNVDEDGEGTETGRFIILELEHGFDVDGCSALAYVGGYNHSLEMQYSVQQIHNFSSADGTVINPGKIAYTQDGQINLVVDEFISAESEGGLPYRFFTPELAEGEKYPLVVWLHGAGERSCDGVINSAQLLANRGGVAWAEPQNQAKNPAFVLAPQSPSGWDQNLVLALIREIIAANPEIDQDRVYIAGCSMGGAGTWNTVLTDSSLFAAAIMAPGGNSGDAETLAAVADLPIWMVQTGDDTYATTEAAYNTLTAMNANVKWTHFETGGNGYPNDHWSWVPTLDNFYSEEYDTTIHDWLFSQRRNGTGFKLITEVFEYGQNVTALVIDAGHEVDGLTLDEETFTVHATNYSPVDGAVTFDGDKTITDIYVNDKMDVSETGGTGTGRYIVIEFEHGFTVDGATTLIYTGGQNLELNLNYTVTQNDAYNYVGGREIPAGSAYIYTGNKDAVVDKFAAGTGECGLDYRLFTPEKEDGEKYPLVVWLHGGGEKGDNNSAQLLANQGGAAWAKPENQEKYPSYVLAPQSPGSWEAEKVVSLIEEIMADNPDIDASRVYIAGCSMGGAGTWNSILYKRDLFAAAIMAPGGNTGDAETLSAVADLPIWMVQTGEDTYESTEAAYNTLTSIGADVKWTHFEPGANGYPNDHWSWVPTLSNFYSEEYGTTVFDWLFSQRNDAKSFDIVTEVFEYGQNTTAVIIDAGRVVDNASLNIDTFNVYARNLSPVNGSVAFDGERVVTKVYANDKKELAETGKDGRYIILELKHGFTVAGATTLIYTGGQNLELDLNYTVTQNASFRYTDGTSVRTDYFQGGRINLVVDDFDAGVSAEGLQYQLFTPEKEEGEKYPLVLWLHGGGERGTNNTAQLLANQGGVAFAKPETQAKYPSYVLAPQATGGWNGAQVVSLVEEIIAANPDIDVNRVYVVGCSMGGAGTWNTIFEGSDLFAAAAPLCAALNPTEEQLELVADMPIWLWHVESDPSVPVRNSTEAYEKLTALGADVKLTILENLPYSEFEGTPDAASGNYNPHWVWVAFLNDEYDENYGMSSFEWLFSQSRATEAQAPAFAYVNEEFEINLTTREDVIGFFLYNEAGRKIGVISATAAEGEYNKLDWTIRTKIGTAGESRTITIVPVSESTGLLEAQEITLGIVEQENAGQIVSAEFLDDSVQVNTPVELEVVTGSAAKKIVIQNENNGKMGATLVARTINSDGTITWTYSMSIGTAGDARQFSVLAQDAAGEYSNPYVAIIRVVA